MRFRRLLPLAAAILAGCGPFHLGSQERAAVIFTNETLDQADVYATLGDASTVRLGSVLATRTDTLYVPSDVTNRGGTTRIIARVLAGTLQPSTPPLTILSSDEIRIRLTSDGRNLVVTP